MKRSKPSTVVGGGEMKRDTSSVVSIAISEGASPTRSSRSVKVEPARTGSPAFQSLVVTIVSRVVRASLLIVVRIMVVARSLVGWKGMFSMAYSPPCPKSEEVVVVIELVVGAVVVVVGVVSVVAGAVVVFTRSTACVVASVVEAATFSVVAVTVSVVVVAAASVVAATVSVGAFAAVSAVSATVSAVF